MPEPGRQPDGDELLRRMREIEARVARLEQRFGSPVPSGFSAGAAPSQVALVESVAAVPVLGRAVLVMAGAYVLRALTESRSLPPQVGVVAGIVYAVLWLIWAARIPAGRRMETTVFSLTSALVLGPLLWESTLRLHAISTWMSAAVLLLFTLIGLLISWQKNLLIVATISILTGVITALALLIGSYDVLPFLLLLLCIAAAVEISACLDHWLSERWVAAVAADLVIALAVYLVTNSRGLPESYAPIPHWSVVAALLVLPAVYLASTITRTLLRRAVFSTFEGAQIAAAFLVAIGGGLRLGGIATAVAGFCVACGIICYALGGWLQGRNSRAYLTFGFLLTSAGILIALPSAWAAGAWSLLALGFLFFPRPAFRWHATGFLLCSLASSGALSGATRSLLGGTDEIGSALPLLAETAVAFVCLALAVRASPPQRVQQMTVAAAAFWTLAGLLAAVFVASYHAAFGVPASHAYCAAGRTTVLAGGAIVLAWAGSRRTDIDIVPLTYPVMALSAYRLLLVDLRQDSKAALVISLLAFGAALLLIPRLLKSRQTSSS